MCDINQRDSEGRRHGVWTGLHADIIWKGRFHHGKLNGLLEWYSKYGIAYIKTHYLLIK